MAGSVARRIFEKESGIEEARKSFVESMSSTSYNGNVSVITGLDRLVYRVLSPTDPNDLH